MTHLFYTFGEKKKQLIIKLNKMAKYSCSVSTGVLESKKCIVYASSESEAKAKVESAGYRLAYQSFSDETYTNDGYIDGKERDGDLIVLR